MKDSGTESEHAAVTTCGWVRHFFDSGGSSGF
jgi:hypothetical protein